MNEWPYVWASYAVTWATLLGYTGYLLVRRRRAKRRWEDG